MTARSLAASVLACAALAAAPAAAQTFNTSAGDVTVSTVARGLEFPWSLAFMPDGQMLVTERPGRMRIVTRDGRLSPAVSSVPRVFAEGQAGLEDVILARDFAQSHTIYFCYAEAADGGGRIAVARAKLVVDETPHLDAVKTIFHQKGPPSRGSSIINIGCRMAQAPDGNLFVTLGDHVGNSRQARMAQTLDNHIGKIVRIRPDGSAPPDNPFVNKPGALPEIWAYGIRNSEGLAFNPADGKLWEQEHGPKGGDEINIIQKGGNYGWPVVSFGVNYDGSPVGDGKQRAPGMIDSIWHWTPSIATSGMMFYTGDLFPQWKGSLFNGALKYQLVSRVTLDGDKAVKEERMLQDLNERIRDVRQGPDGAIYLLTDNKEGRILRMTPAK
ncbi:MAG TPA: PQQ-dependent sugar dehydrogenase [Pseudolabrys sp.]